MSFKKIDDTGVLPGPRALFICGFPEKTETIMAEFLKDNGIEDIAVGLCREDSLLEKISTVLSKKSDYPLIPSEKLPPVMLWSGIEHKELDQSLGNFKDTGLKRPIFATSTEHNLDFTVKELLQHLISEQKSMKEAMKKD